MRRERVYIFLLFIDIHLVDFKLLVQVLVYNMITFWVIAVLDEVTAVTVSRFIPVSTMLLLVSLPPPPFNPPYALKILI